MFEEMQKNWVQASAAFWGVASLLKSLLPVLAVCFSEHKREPPPVLLLSLFLKFSRQQVFLAVFLLLPLPVCSFALLAPHALAVGAAVALTELLKHHHLC